MVRLSKLLLLMLGTAVFLAACTMDFLTETDDDGNNENCPVEYVYEDTDGDGIDDRKSALDCEENLLWWEKYVFNADENRTGVQRYLPKGETNNYGDDSIQWTKLFDWDREYVSLEAYFLPTSTTPPQNDHELQWYSRFSYDISGNLLMKANYDARGQFQWFEAREYSDTGQVVNKARYTEAGPSSAEGEWFYTFEFDDQDRETLQKKYLPGDLTTPTVTIPEAVSPQLQQGSAHAFDIPLPTSESLTPLPDTPSFGSPETQGWALTWTKKTWHRENGQFSMKYDTGNKPLELELSSEELEGEIKIALAYDEKDRPKSKITTYQGTEVLNLGFDYTSAGLVEKVTTSGASLLVPLDYEITYDENNLPTRIDINKDDTTLQYFEYTYQSTDTDGGPTIVDQYLDPLSFGGKVASITQYDGDGNQIGIYSFTYDDINEEIRIEAQEYDNESDTYLSKGYFLIKLGEENGPADGKPVVFSSYNKDDERVWYYEYEYDEEGNRIKEARYRVDEALNTEELSVPENLNPESFGIELLLK